jgi:hypothetical protein
LYTNYHIFAFNSLLEERNPGIKHNYPDDGWEISLTSVLASPSKMRRWMLLTFQWSELNACSKHIENPMNRVLIQKPAASYQVPSFYEEQASLVNN